MTEPSGPIALLGSGEFEPWTRGLDLALLRSATSGDGTVAIVPTASALEGPTFDRWARKGLEHYAALGVPAHVIDLRDRADAERRDVVGQLDRCSLIFFSGGNAAYLAATLAGSPFWGAVLDRLADGAAFAGCSAGACAAGAFAPESVTDFVWESGWNPGLGLLPDLWVLPHFDALDQHRHELRSYFLERVPETAWALGLDERTAALWDGARWSVVGEGGVFLGRGRGARRFAAGETFALDGDAAVSFEGADRDLVLAFEPLPPGSGPVALLSSEQFSARTLDVDRALLERCGPSVGVVLEADPDGAADLARLATAHYRGLDAEPGILRPGDDPQGVDVVFLAGGDPRQLVPALQDAPLWMAASARWRAGTGLAGTSAGAMALCERCLFAEEGADVPTRWGRGLGPLRGVALAVHASSRPEGWVEDVASTAPVDVVAMDDGTAVLLEAGRPPIAFGEGAVTRHGAAVGEAPPRGGPTLRLYHRTAASGTILRTGFADSLENPRRDGAWEGSWFSDVPLPPEEGPAGDDVLVLEVPVAVAERYEFRDPSKPYREFVLPREVANRYGPPRTLAADGTVRDPEPSAADVAEEPWGGRDAG